MIDSRSLDDLLPPVKELAEQFVAACKDVGVDILIYCTYRDAEKQAELYAEGRTKPGKRVTDAKPGESFHQYRCAMDFVPVVHGKARWDDMAVYERCGEIWESLDPGLCQWAGRWTGDLHEEAHVQWTGGLTLAQLQAGQVPA